MTDTETRNFELINKSGYKINGYIKYPPDKNRLPLIIIMHGFKAYKDWGFFPYITTKLASKGAIAVCFDFSLNGITNINDELFDVELFSGNTISQELEDAITIITEIFNCSSLIDEGIIDKFNGEIYLLGHSLGGAIAILAAREVLHFSRLIEQNNCMNHPLLNNKAEESPPGQPLGVGNIKKVALWSTISHFDRYTKRQKAQWHRQGFMEFVNNSTGQLLRMNVSFLEDIEKNALKFSLIQAVNEIKVPVLIVHGNKDITVPIKEGRELAKNISKDFLKFIEIKNTGHVFGIEHPFKNTSESLNKALDTTIKFFELE